MPLDLALGFELSVVDEGMLKAGISRAVGDNDRDCWRRLGLTSSTIAGVMALAAVVGFSSSESESDDDDEEEEEEDDAVQDGWTISQCRGMHDMLFVRIGLHDAALFALKVFTGVFLVMIGLTGSSSLESSLLELELELELEPPPALLFFLRLFLGFLFRVLDLATAGVVAPDVGGARSGMLVYVYRIHKDMRAHQLTNLNVSNIFERPKLRSTRNYRSF